VFRAPAEAILQGWIDMIYFLVEQVFDGV
jgi:hypothetical protein